MVRPNLGPGHVERIPGSAEAKRRGRAIVATLCGEQSVAEACVELGIRRARFQELRRRMLVGGMAELEPRAAGRPRRVLAEPSAEVEALRKRNAALEKEVRSLRAQLDLALGLPLRARPKPEPEPKARGPFRPTRTGPGPARRALP